MDVDEVELFQGDLEINELENRLVIRTKGKVEKSLESDVFIIVRPFRANLPDMSKAIIGRHNHIFISEKTGMLMRNFIYINAQILIIWMPIFPFCRGLCRL